MNFRYPMLAKLLLALSVFAAVVPCQRGEGEEGGKMSPERMRELRQAMAEKGLAEEEMEKILRVEEAANAGELPNAMLRGMRRGCAKYCTFAATIKPKQLLPGQSGVMMVSALLKDETVMESPAPIEVANVIAPEHLQLMSADPESLLPLVRHAGAVFTGALAPASVGDYVAGPSHVLPTAGTARFAGALTVDDFQKRLHVVRLDEGAFAAAAPVVAALAEAEGLVAHADSVRLRSGGAR